MKKIESTKLQVKDLISIGIFTAIYLALFFVILIPTGLMAQIYLFGGAISALVLGPVYMLYLAKVGKKYSILIMGIMMSTAVALMTGGLWTEIVIGYGVSLIAELIANSGKYKSFFKNMISYIFFSFWPFGVFGAFWIMKDKMLESSRAYGQTYAETIEGLITPTFLIVIIVVTIIAAIISSYIGKRMLKKHFKRSGII